MSKSDLSERSGTVSFTSGAASLQKALQWAADQLDTHAIPNARLEARWLLMHILKTSEAYLFANPQTPLNPSQLEAYHTLIQQRCEEVPFAYLVGEAGFWDLTLAITPAVLIPRGDTELLVELALNACPNDVSWNLLDLGTGSGAIGLTLAKHRPLCHIWLGDKAPDALRLTEQNRLSLDLSNATCLQTDWFSHVPETSFQLILSNPPYLSTQDPHLSTSIRHEPYSALVSGPTGLEDLDTLIREARRFLAPGGQLMLEHGKDQGQQVREYFHRYGYRAIETHRDLQQHERVTCGKWHLRK